MLKGFIVKTAAFAAFLALLLCCGCNFNTTVITDADSPDTVAESFFSALKRKDFDACDSLLAENATIRVTDNTDSGFADILVDFYLDNLTYESLGQAEVSALSAVKKIRVSTPDKAAFLEWFKSNMTANEKRYIKENNLVSIDHQNTEDVRKFLAYAVTLYEDDIQMKNTDLEISFSFQNNRWLMVGTTELVNAVYGGEDNEKQ